MDKSEDEGQGEIIPSAALFEYIKKSIITSKGQQAAVREIYEKIKQARGGLSLSERQKNCLLAEQSSTVSLRVEQQIGSKKVEIKVKQQDAIIKRGAVRGDKIKEKLVKLIKILISTTRSQVTTAFLTNLTRQLLSSLTGEAPGQPISSELLVRVVLAAGSWDIDSPVSPTNITEILILNMESGEWRVAGRLLQDFEYCRSLQHCWELVAPNQVHALRQIWSHHCHLRRGNFLHRRVNWLDEQYHG